MNLLKDIHFSNAWIMVIPFWLIGMLIASTNKQGMKRASDMSWYRSVDRIASFLSMFFMILFMLISVFISINYFSVLFYIGLLFVLIGFSMHITAKIAYGNTKQNNPVTRGIYKYSRNPMYMSFTLILFGTTIASRSVLLAVLWILTVIFMHILVIGEERYCLKKYGGSYKEYMKNTPRYFLFF